MNSCKDLRLTEAPHSLCHASILRLLSLLRRVNEGFKTIFLTGACKCLPVPVIDRRENAYRMPRPPNLGTNSIAEHSFTMKSIGMAFPKMVVPSHKDDLNTLVYKIRALCWTLLKIKTNALFASYLCNRTSAAHDIMFSSNSHYSNCKLQLNNPYFFGQIS